ncbi:dynamin-binding -like, partial [Brachionus plicatilis]
YAQNPEITNYIKNRIKIMKGISTDLSVIAIKPVQRVFKYPLFINRIIENLEKSDEEYLSYMELRDKMSKALDFINEYKRAQDLVAKYLNKPSVSNDLGSHSFTKKVQTFKKLKDRLSLQIYQSFGWTNLQINDEEFDKVESEYRNLENTLRNYFNDLNSFSVNLKSTLDFEKDIFNKLLFIFDNEFEKFYHFDTSANKHRNKFSKEYTDLLMGQVIRPVKRLLNALNGPDKLIKKRYDKQLDYQNALFERENKNLNDKDMENKLNRAKKDYQALNKQLIDELPMLSRSIFQVLLKSFKIFTFQTHKFIDEIHMTLKNDITASRIDLSRDFNLCRNSMASALNRLMSSFTDLNQTNEWPPSEPKILIQTQTEEERNKVLRTFAIDNIYMVTQRYIANVNLCQLSQNVNDIVGLKKPKSPSGDSNTWFVYNGKNEGFIPAVVLEPYKKYYKQNNLICFDDANCSGQMNYIAKFSLQGKTSNMINLIQGECYKLLDNKDLSGNCEWWLVEDKNGNIGYAPCNFLQLLN